MLISFELFFSISCDQTSISLCMHILTHALVSDRVHFLDSSSLSNMTQTSLSPSPLFPHSISSLLCSFLLLVFQIIQTQNRIFLECVIINWSLGVGRCGKMLITNMIIRLWGSEPYKCCIQTPTPTDPRNGARWKSGCNLNNKNHSWCL